MSNVQIDVEVINKLVSLLQKLDSASNKLERVDYNSDTLIDIAEIRKDVEFIKNQILEHCKLLEGEKGVVAVVRDLQKQSDTAVAVKTAWTTWQVAIVTLVGAFVTGLVIAAFQAWLGKVFK